MLALSTGLEGGEPYRESYQHYNPEDLRHWSENTETQRGGFATRQQAEDFLRNEVHPDLAREGNYSIEQHPQNDAGTWHIFHPRAAIRSIVESGQQVAMNPSHAVHAPAEPDYHDPAHPKIIAWHNDIAYTVPVHPQALSKEHMQALADYEVHRRQHEKLEKELHGEHDEYGDRPWVVSEEAARRLDRSQQQLNRLRDIAQGAGHAAVGTINSYHKFERRKFYQAVRQGQRRQYRGQVLPDRDAAEESMPGGQIEEFPGIWSIVDHRGRVVWSGLSSHPYFSNFGDPGWRERVLADARNKNLVARRLSHSFGDPPDIDMSKVPITTWGKTRKKTGEWFSNLPPGMLALGDEPRITIDENGPNVP
jgi:hypothetical protein